jgi:hypothetical protein
VRILFHIRAFVRVYVKSELFNKDSSSLAEDNK